jgi:hypothetical protein
VVDDQEAEQLEHLGLDMDRPERPGECEGRVVQDEVAEPEAHHRVMVAQRHPPRSGCGPAKAPEPAPAAPGRRLVMPLAQIDFARYAARVEECQVERFHVSSSRVLRRSRPSSWAHRTAGPLAA